MGASASVSASDQLTEDEVKILAGNKWDETLFSSMATDGTITGAQFMEAAAAVLNSPLPSDDDLKLHVGDIVEAQGGGFAFFCEGVIASVNSDGTYGVDFGDGEPAEDVPTKSIRKIKHWHHMEINDRVKVKESDGCLSFEATIIAVDEITESYTVRYHGDPDEEPEIEAGVADSRIQKIGSMRLSAGSRWATLKGVVKLMGLMHPASKSEGVTTDGKAEDGKAEDGKAEEEKTEADAEAKEEAPAEAAPAVGEAKE